MKTTMMRMVGSMRACALAAVLVGGLMGVGPLAPSPAMAQVKSMADVKSLLKPELPAGALEVSAAMKSDKVGDTITVRGNVAMSKDAFVEKQSVFTLVEWPPVISFSPERISHVKSLGWITAGWWKHTSPRTEKSPMS